jgi:hypothetical protein
VSGFFRWFLMCCGRSFAAFWDCVAIVRGSM